VIRPDEEPVPKTGVRLARIVSSSLTASAFDARAHRPTGGRRLRTPEIRVRISVGPFGDRGLGARGWGTRKRRQLVRRGRPRSLASGLWSLTPSRKVAGYGWPGRSAKAVLACRDEGSTPLPSAFDGIE
jgi:hypothetical protein